MNQMMKSMVLFLCFGGDPGQVFVSSAGDLAMHERTWIGRAPKTLVSNCLILIPVVRCI